MKPNLSAKQIQAIEYLAQGKQQKETASLIGVAEETVCRWMKDANFRQAVNEKAKASIPDYVSEQIQHLLYLSRNAQKESVRFQAARELLYMAGLKPVEQIEQIGDTTIVVDIADATDPATD